MDFIWKPQFEGIDGPNDDPDHKGLFTHLMYNTYTVPCGIPMTNYWNKEDAGDIRLEFMSQLRQNETFQTSFIACMEEMSDAYETENVLVTWGYDFAYWDANNTFGLIDDIMAFLGKKSTSL